MISNPEIKEYVQFTHLFPYKDDTKIRDLLRNILDIVEEYPSPERDDLHLWSKFYGIINGKEYELNMDYPVKNYVYHNSVDGICWFKYTVASRGGYGGMITTTIRLYMPSSEKGHERIPHVHIRKGEYKKKDLYSNTIRINLNDYSVMDQRERDYKKLFSKNERGLIMWILQRHQSDLIDNYEAMLKGALPEVITIDFSNCSYQSGSAMLS